MSDPTLVSVIPNATDTTVFTPSESVKYKSWYVISVPTVVHVWPGDSFLCGQMKFENAVSFVIPSPNTQ